MKEELLHIKFTNSQNPTSSFDIIRIEDLLKRKDLDHSPFHAHLVEFYMIIFFDKGENKHTIDFTDFKCEKGTLLTIRKDQIHKFHDNKSTRGFILLFTEEFLISYLDKVEAFKSLQLFNEFLAVPKIQLIGKDLKEIGNSIKELLSEYHDIGDEYSSGIIRSQLHILVSKLHRIKSIKNQINFNRKYLPEFVKLQKLIEEHAPQNSKVMDYARMMGKSTKTLNNITQTIINKTAKEFIDEICAVQIKRILINTDLSIKEIAFELGFEETTNFYKYFKRQTQLTPEQFRFNFR